MKTILIICSFNAYLMKLLSKYGLFYEQAKKFKKFVIRNIFPYQVPKSFDKAMKCMPCKMFWLSFIECYIYFLINWKISLNGLFMPFVLGAISVIIYTFLNPRHEDSQD